MARFDVVGLVCLGLQVQYVCGSSDRFVGAAMVVSGKRFLHGWVFRLVDLRCRFGGFGCLLGLIVG